MGGQGGTKGAHTPSATIFETVKNREIINTQRNKVSLKKKKMLKIKRSKIYEFSSSKAFNFATKYE